MSDLLQEDEDNRRRALELDSFIVEAPAGAGKTELLTQRYLRLLATVEEPEEIIAITFTNKAAGEMRQRIQDSLALARDTTVPEAAHKRVTFELARAALARSTELGWQIESQPGRLRLPPSMPYAPAWRGRCRCCRASARSPPWPRKPDGITKRRRGGRWIISKARATTSANMPKR